MLCRMEDMDIEDRIFELSDVKVLPVEIVDAVVGEYEIERSAAWALVAKVRRERGTPRLARVDEALARLRRLSFI